MVIYPDIKMTVLRYYLFIFLIGISPFGFTQKHNLNFAHLDVNSGLSQSNVLCILQGSRGFMWFGTQDGLNKYDGYSITVYRRDSQDSNSLSRNYINDISEDKNGNLWIATWGGGLNKYDRQKDRFVHFKNDPLNSNSISGNFLSCLLIDGAGSIWISTESGLDVFDPGKNSFIHYKSNKNDKSSLSDNGISRMIEDYQHNIWISTTNGGLNLFNRKKNTFTHFQHDAKDTTSVSSNDIVTIFEDSRHNIWAGTNGAGLNLMDRATGKFRTFRKNKTGNSLCDDVIFSIAEDNDGVLWIGSENGGLSKFNPETGIFVNYQHNEYDDRSLSSSSINRIYKDKKGNIWIGTYNAGVSFINNDMNKFTHYRHSAFENSLTYNNVRSIFEDDKNNIWIGTDGGGVNLFDRNTGRFIPFKHKEGNKNSICGDYVLSINQDGYGNIWIGTWGDGLTVFNPEKNSYKHYKNNPLDSYSITGNNIWAIFKDHNNNMWIGVQGKGLCRFDHDHFKSYTHEKGNLNSNNILSLFEDSRGKFWVGTDGAGLNRFDPKTDKSVQYTQSESKSSLSDNSVNCIFEDEAGNLWIGTNDGLSYLDIKTDLFTNYTTRDGLPNGMIFGILEDSKKNLWISTNKGISQFNPSTKKFRNFSVADGLQSNEFKQSYLKSRNGLMYFGGINGFNEFNPDSIRDAKFDPPLVITDFRISNRKVPIAANDDDPSPLKKNITETREITLPFSHSVISFEFASLNYIPEEKKQYAYMLEHFDKTWNEIGPNRTANYTNLDPGKYIFRVKGLNNEGNWSSREIVLRIIITPPFWLTWWFKIFLGVGILAAFIIFYRIRVNNIKKWGQQLEQQVVERTGQLAHSVQEEQRARQEAENARYETDQANKDLEKKNKEVEQFAYIASHDLQEPLRTVSSFAGLLQKQYQGKLDEKADRYFNFMLDASERMKTLIKSLLEYSRIGRKSELEEVDCNTILKSVLADLHVAIREAKANISHMPLPVINGYPIEIKQLFQNLIVNAIKFRKKDTIPVIKISIRKLKNAWEFSFKDNGIGIEEQHLEKIFNIFQRLHNRTEYEGSGIGLSYCKKIVELHHGRIWVESVPGMGSTFYFTIRDATNSLPANPAKSIA